uniref:Uncharacterized protein n=1 Tax=Caenorhabditis tropicalis TaxID=1561998 RepID=A0A1I7UGW8_9PELO
MDRRHQGVQSHLPPAILAFKQQLETMTGQPIPDEMAVQWFQAHFLKMQNALPPGYHNQPSAVVPYDPRQPPPGYHFPSMPPPQAFLPLQAPPQAPPQAQVPGSVNHFIPPIRPINRPQQRPGQQEIIPIHRAANGMPTNHEQVTPEQLWVHEEAKRLEKARNKALKQKAEQEKARWEAERAFLAQRSQLPTTLGQHVRQMEHLVQSIGAPTVPQQTPPTARPQTLLGQNNMSFADYMQAQRQLPIIAGPPMTLRDILPTPSEIRRSSQGELSNPLPAKRMREMSPVEAPEPIVQEPSRIESPEVIPIEMESQRMSEPIEIEEIVEDEEEEMTEEEERAELEDTARFLKEVRSIAEILMTDHNEMHRNTYFHIIEQCFKLFEREDPPQKPSQFVGELIEYFEQNGL